MAKNEQLHAAKSAKNDEFFTIQNRQPIAKKDDI